MCLCGPCAETSPKRVDRRQAMGGGSERSRMASFSGDSFQAVRVGVKLGNVKLAEMKSRCISVDLKSNDQHTSGGVGVVADAPVVGNWSPRGGLHQSDDSSQQPSPAARDGPSADGNIGTPRGAEAAAVRHTAAIEALCSRTTSGCQRYGSPRCLTSTRCFWQAAAGEWVDVPLPEETEVRDVMRDLEREHPPLKCVSTPVPLYFVTRTGVT
jgi:hypothetical protein